MPLAKRRSPEVAPVPVSAPPSSSQMKARPEPLCSPKARIAPVPAVWSRGPSSGVRTVEHGGILAQRAVGIDQRALRQFLAAAACHQHLAFGDDRGRKIQHDRVLPRARNADAIGRGREPLLDAAERRNQQRAGGIDEMHGHQAFGRGHLRPVADAADMPGVAQRDCGKSRLLALLDAGLHRKRRHRLTIAELAVDHGERWRIDDDLARSGWERRCPSSSSGHRRARGSRRGCHGR